MTMITVIRNDHRSAETALALVMAEAEAAAQQSKAAESALESKQTAAPILRGSWGEIVGKIEGRTPADIIATFAAALPKPFVNFDKYRRGDALNLDVYGYDADQNVAVVQIRHAFCPYRNGYLSVHKDYVLVGINEGTGQAFRHPISASAVRAAIRKDPGNPAAAVRGAQCWMWGVTNRQLQVSLAAGQRQGDILLVRERTPSAANIAAELAREVTIAESHLIRATRIIRTHKGRILADTPSLWHAKAQHAPVFADWEGWFSVRAADEAETWNWGVRLGD